MSSSDTLPVTSIEALIKQFSQVIAHQEYEKIATILALHPTSFEVHFLDGSYHAEHGEYQHAKEAFERCLGINPEFHIARFQLCFLAILNQDMDIFNEYVEPLLLIGDNSYLTIFTKALIDILRDETEQAKMHLQEGLMLNNDNLALNENMNRLLSLISGEQVTDDDKHISEADELNTSTNTILLDIYKNKFN